MTPHRPLGLTVLIAALAGAADASAQTLTLAPYSADTRTPSPLPVRAVAPSRPAPDLANPLDGLAPTARPANSLQSAVFATTAVDHRFSGRDGVTGSLGFLCGLQPGHTENGGAAAFGSDPHGRFLGAKLSFAFR